jgi:hypothetical protein
MTAVVWLFVAEEGGGRQDDDDAGQNMSGTMERGKLARALAAIRAHARTRWGSRAPSAGPKSVEMDVSTNATT